MHAVRVLPVHRHTGDEKTVGTLQPLEPEHQGPGRPQTPRSRYIFEQYWTFLSLRPILWTVMWLATSNQSALFQRRVMQKFVYNISTRGILKWYVISRRLQQARSARMQRRRGRSAHEQRADHQRRRHRDGHATNGSDDGCHQTVDVGHQNDDIGHGLTLTLAGNLK